MQNWPRWRKSVFPGSFQAHFCARCGKQIRTVHRPLLECRTGRTGERRLRNDRHLVPVVRKTTHALPVPAILLGRDQKNPLLPTAAEPLRVEHDSALPCWPPDVVRHWYPCVAALGLPQCRLQPGRSSLRGEGRGRVERAEGGSRAAPGPDDSTAAEIARPSSWTPDRSLLRTGAAVPQLSSAPSRWKAPISAIETPVFLLTKSYGTNQKLQNPNPLLGTS